MAFVLTKARAGPVPALLLELFKTLPTLPGAIRTHDDVGHEQQRYRQSECRDVLPPVA